MMQSRKKSLETLDRNLKPCKKTKVGSGYWKHGELSCYTEASQRTRYLIWSLNLKLYTAYASQILTLSVQIPPPPIQVVGSQAIVRAGSRASVCTVVSSIFPYTFSFSSFFQGHCWWWCVQRFIVDHQLHPFADGTPRPHAQFYFKGKSCSESVTLGCKQLFSCT